jgi:hypothetical protein
MELEIRVALLQVPRYPTDYVICHYPAVSGGASLGSTLFVLDDPGTGQAQINHAREII